MFKNNYGVKLINLTGKVRHYCPLGNDWCSTDVLICVDSPENIPDYCDVSTFLKTLDGQTLIIEEICLRVYEFMVDQTSGIVSVTAETKDAEHLPVKVTVA